VPDEKDDDNTSLDRVRGERALTRRSGFMARSVRELAEKARRARELAQKDRKDREVQSTEGIEVVFPDKNLEAAVRETLEMPQASLTREHLKGMKKLEADNKAIDDLTGLEHAVNLTTLELYKNQISDVSPLASLTNLTSLTLDSNEISDVSPLASLTNLTWLHLRNNPLSRVSVDVHLPNLRSEVFFLET